MGNAGITVIAFNELQNRANTLQSKVNDLENKVSEVDDLKNKVQSLESLSSSLSSLISSAGDSLPTRPSGRKRRSADDLPNIKTPEDLFGDLSYLNEVRNSRQLVRKTVFEFKFTKLLSHEI